MFGYVTIYPPELKVKDYKKYRAYYCGLCRILKEKYGYGGQLTLTYDMTFVVILLMSLYEETSNSFRYRCPLHPLGKHTILQGNVTEYAAAMNVILAYYHLEDDWLDEKSIKGICGMKLLKSRVKGIERIYPRQCAVIKKKLKDLQELERQDVKSVDIVAGCFGELMSELFVYKEDQWEESLRKMGFYLGKFIYILDAFDDIENDRMKGQYNPLKELYNEIQGDKQIFQLKCHGMLEMMIAEVAVEFEKLPCVQDVDILRNILHDGVWVKYKMKVNK